MRIWYRVFPESVKPICEAGTDEEADSVKNNADEISPALKMPAEWRLVLKDGYEQRMGNMN